MYETGFAVKRRLGVDASAWVTEDVNGNSVEARNEGPAPRVVEQGRLLEVYRGVLELGDGSAPRARLRLASGNYLAGEFSAGDVVDLNKYAADRIAAFRKQHDDEDLRRIARRWVTEKRILCWKSRAPWPLEDGQHVQAEGLSDTGLEVSAPGGLGLRIEFSDLTLTNLEDSEQELQERQRTYARRALKPVMSVEEAMELLRKVDLIKPYLPGRPTSTIEVTASDDLFALQALRHLQGSDRSVQPTEINAFADRSTKPITIRLRRRAKGVGTVTGGSRSAVVHPLLASRCGGPSHGLERRVPRH